MSEINVKGKTGKVSKEYAISTEELDKLISNTKGKNQVIIAALGKLGMREGELIHMRPSWIHVEDETSKSYGQNHIRVPLSGIKCDCNDCLLRDYRKIRQKEVPKRKRTKEWYLKVQEDFYNLKESGELKKLGLNPIWKPKTKSGGRPIPFLDSSSESIIVNFYRENKKIDLSRMAIWNRVMKLSMAILEKPLFPHALRATYSTILANKGISSGSLKTIMGWSTLTTADSYIQSDARKMFKELKELKKT